MQLLQRILLLIALSVLLLIGYSPLALSAYAAKSDIITTMPPSFMTLAQANTDGIKEISTPPATNPNQNQPSYIQDNKPTIPIISNNWMLIAGEFWILGLLLAFTPCILPLLIVVSGFLGEEAKNTPKRRTIMLSITYVLALATTYAITGLAAGLFGIYLHAYLQNPWVIISFSIIILLLALSLLDIYTITLPASIRHIIVRHNKLQEHYRYFEVAIMGILATLIASPCLAAPLITILGFIGTTGSIILGFIALFFVGVGIGTPLLVATTIGKDVLPHDEKWQPVLKQFFGLALIAVAIWISSRVIKPEVAMVFWSILIIYTANYLYSLHHSHFDSIPNLWKSICIMILTYGVALLFGGMIGSHNPTNPLSIKNLLAPDTVVMKKVTTQSALDNLIVSSTAQQKPIMIYFSADWCINCQEFSQDVINNQDVAGELTDFTLIEVDLTDSNSPAYDIASKYSVIGTPEIIFYDANGKLYPGRIAGKVSVQTFLDTLAKIKAAHNLL